MTLCLQAAMTRHLKVQTQCLRLSLVKRIKFLGGMEGSTINFLNSILNFGIYKYFIDL